MRKSIALALFIAVAAGCSLLPGGGAELRKYTLGYTQVEAKQNPFSINLVVDAPMIYPPLDTSRIAQKPSQNALEFYAGAEWANPLKKLIQESVVYSIESSRIVTTVSRPGEGIKGDMVLIAEVRNFEIELFSQPPLKAANVLYVVHLANLPSRKIIATQSFHANIPTDAESMDLFVSTLDKANIEVMVKVLKWIEEVVKTYKPENS